MTNQQFAPQNGDFYGHVMGPTCYYDVIDIAFVANALFYYDVIITQRVDNGYDLDKVTKLRLLPSN